MSYHLSFIYLLIHLLLIKLKKSAKKRLPCASVFHPLNYKLSVLIFFFYFSSKFYLINHRKYLLKLIPLLLVTSDRLVSQWPA